MANDINPLDLGPYADDPRIWEIINDPTRGRAVAVIGGQVWQSKDNGVWCAECFADPVESGPPLFSSAVKALEFVLGEPQAGLIDLILDASKKG